MKRIRCLLTCLTAACVPLVFAGCGNQSTTENKPEANTAQTTEPNDHDDDHHDHPVHGPHGGELIELGHETYHGELVASKEDGVTIYILGSDAKTAKPIDATELTVNATLDGNAQQFKLAASREESDSEGKCSRFVSTDESFVTTMLDEHTVAKLVFSADGTQYSGKIPHPHDGDHDHDHDH